MSRSVMLMFVCFRYQLQRQIPLSERLCTEHIEVSQQQCRGMMLGSTVYHFILLVKKANYVRLTILNSTTNVKRMFIVGFYIQYCSPLIYSSYFVLCVVLNRRRLMQTGPGIRTKIYTGQKNNCSDLDVLRHVSRTVCTDCYLFNLPQRKRDISHVHMYS